MKKTLALIFSVVAIFVALGAIDAFAASTGFNPSVCIGGLCGSSIGLTGNVTTSTNPNTINIGGSSSTASVTINNIVTSTYKFVGSASVTIVSSTDGTGQGILTFTASGGSGSSTNVFGTNGVTVNQSGINATATLDTTYAAVWTAIETFSKGLTANGTTTLASTTNALLFTNSSGNVLAYNATVCGAGNAFTGLSATGTPVCAPFQNVTSTYIAGGTATGPALTFATTTTSGKFNIACAASTCTLTIPPSSDYLSSSTTYVSTFNTRSGAVTLSSGDVTTALGFTPISTVTVNAFAGTTFNITGTGNVTSSVSSGNTTFSLINSGASAGSYNWANLTVSSSGIVTAVSGNATPVTSLTAGGCVTVSGSTGAITLGSTCLTGTKVDSLNGITGATTIAAGTGISIASSSQTITVTNNGATSFNTQTGATSYVVTCISGCTATTSTTSTALSITSGGGSSTVAFLANGATFLSTSTINFQQGTNITITTSTNGTYTISASGGGGSNNATGTVDMGAYFNATNTLASNSILYVPANFSTVGCSGSSTATTLQGCINAMEQSQVGVASGTTIWITNSVPSSAWTGEINLNVSGLLVSLDCTAGVNLFYGGTGAALDFNFGQSTGHLSSDDYGCTYRGNASLIAAGNTNTATTTGVVFGGSNGAVGITFHDNTINGFGTDVDISSNAYMLNIQNNSISGGDGTSTYEVGSLIQVNTASNSGEGIDIVGNNLTDPGNSNATNCIVFQHTSISNAYMAGNQMDDCEVYNGYSNGDLSIDAGNHFEDSDFSNYQPYEYIYGTSSQASYMNISGNLFEIDDTNSGTIPPELILHGQQVYVAGNVIQNYGGQTIPLFVSHSLNNGTEVETVCGNAFYNGTLTNIVSNQPYSQAAMNTCISDTGNSYPVSIQANSNNTANIRNGNQNVATFDQNGNWTLGGAAGGVTISHAFIVNGSATLNSSLTQSGGVVSLASTTINGNATTTSLTITSVTGTQCLHAVSGVVSGTGSDCGSGGGSATTTINGVSGPSFTFSIVNTSTASSITTSTANLFLNLLEYTSGTNINVASNGVINFVNPGFVTAASATIWSAAQTYTGGATFNSTSTFNSSTIFNANVSSTANISASTFNASTSITNQSVTSSLVLNGAGGLEGAYGGSTCSSGKYVASITGAGVSGCTFIATSSITGVFTSTNGGIGTSTNPTDSQVLSASGTTPTWKNIVAGTNTTVTTTTTSIAINATAGGSGTVTTSSAGTANTLPIWTSGSALGNSTISQPTATSTVINSSSTCVGGACTGPSSLIWIASSSSGYWDATGTIPTVSSCGTSPTSTGNQWRSRITVGSLTVTGCTETFPIAFVKIPSCMVDNESMSITSALTYTVSTSTLVISQATGLAGDNLDVDCVGQSE